MSAFSDYTFRMKNEEQLQQYLLGLSFPLKIDEVYKKIVEISIDSINEYPNFNLKVERKLDEKKQKTTGRISLNYGQLKIFTMTIEGKTISIDSDGN